MSTSKETILSAIRQAQPPQAPLPELDADWTTYADRRRQFLEALASVGGEGHVVGRAELDAAVRRLPVYAEARQIVSLLPGVGEANVDLAAAASPHELDDVDLAILPGEFCVAENAAVWVTDRQVAHRVIYYLCQHLVLFVPASQIVDHMHAAYERLLAAGQGGGATFAEPVFGAFLSGPSKTADIEQALVIGAHGPKSLTVYLVEE